MPLSKCAPYECLLPCSILGSALEEEKHKGREKVPSSFSSQRSISHHSWEMSVCLVLENNHLEKEDTPPLWRAVCFGRPALSDIKMAFSCKLVLTLSLGDTENQSAPSFLHPALSKEKCHTSLYKTNQNPPVFLNPLLTWHTSLRTSPDLFASNLPKLYQAWLSCWIQSLADCFSSSFKCSTCHQTLMYA